MEAKLGSSFFTRLTLRTNWCLETEFNRDSDTHNSVDEGGS